MKKFTWFLLILPLILFSCKKESPVGLQSDRCEPLPHEPPFGWIHIFPDFGYSAPCFNPENPDEVIFREHNNVDGRFWICKLNLATMKKEYVFEGNFWSEPEWGEGDWIIFTLSDGNIYKIKSTGSDLTQLTTGGKCFSPKWTYDFNKIQYNTYQNYRDSSGQNIHEGFIAIMDLNGSVLDSLFAGDIYWNYYSEKLGAKLDQNSLKIYLVDVDSVITHIVIGNFDLMSTGLFWIDDNTLIWYDKESIFRVHIYSGQTELLKSTCNSNYYMSPSYSSQARRIIWRKIKSEPKGGNLYGNSFLVMMDPDASNEETLDIPE